MIPRRRVIPSAAAILFAVAAAALPAAGASPADEACLGCHSDPTLSTTRGGRTIPLGVDPAALAASPHRDVGCADCHAGFDPGSLPHAARMRPVDCLACHGDAGAEHPFHASLRHVTGTDGPPGTSCRGCHGTHDVRARDDAASPWHPSRTNASCGRCHAGVVERFLDSSHGRAQAAGQPGAPDCLGCHAQPITAARAGGETAEHKIAQERICLSCHLESPEVRARMVPTAGFIAAYEKSVHGAALHRGDAAAANCVDCHGSHEMKKGFDPGSRAHRDHISATCGTCHRVIARIYGEGVHGAAVARGVVEAPVCTDCHGEHAILRPSDPRSPVAAANVSEQVCSPCHSSVRLGEKYGIASDRFRTFSDSYHGLAIKGGSLEAANCASCHGSHDIRPSTDRDSSIHPDNLAATCGRCHPGANERFAIGSVHLVEGEPDPAVLYWISTAYVALIVATVGGMALHNGLDFLKKARHRLRVRRGLESEEPAGRALYLRMTAGERLQHGALMLSFTVLVLTGFMLRYPTAWWVEALRRLSDHLFELRSLAHRVAGVVMIAASAAHIAYLVGTARGRRFFRDMLPARQDLRDAVAAVRFNLGLRPRGPRFGRFGYVEKSEYWALVWGTVVMAATGLVLWFENTFIGLLTKLGWDVARTIHFYEAWLATLAILVWHIYYVIFNPDAYPMNTAWITGTISEEEMEREHPLELEAIRRRQAEEEAREDAAGGGTRPDGRGAKGGGGDGR